MEERDIVLEDLCEIVEDKKSHPRPVSDVDDETKRFGSRESQQEDLLDPFVPYNALEHRDV